MEGIYSMSKDLEIPKRNTKKYLKIFPMAIFLLLLLVNPCAIKVTHQETVDTDENELEHVLYAESQLHEGEDLYDFVRKDDDSIELVIGLENENMDDLISLIRQVNGKVTNKISMNQRMKALVVNLPYEVLATFKTEVQPFSRYVEPIRRVSVDIVPNDSYIDFQWALEKIQACSAWNYTTGSKKVLIAIVDTGINYNHPDLAGNYIPLGHDFVNNDSDPMDDHGHGTHCAGIAAANLNNSLGISGLAQVSIMAEKALDYGGSGWDDDLANAIIHATDSGAKIISMSWGGGEDSFLIHDAIEYAFQKGVLLIASAGNDHTRRKHYPAAYDEVTAVAATTILDNTAHFSNYGEWIELAAPGVQILSTYLYHYNYLSGTSMSAPHVVGLAALIWSRFPWMSRDQVRAHLRLTSDDLGEPGFDFKYGWGRINAEKAVETPAPEHDLIILNWQKPRHVIMGDTAIINCTILNYGKSNEENVRLELLANGTIGDRTTISSIESGESVEASLLWMPTEEGKYHATVKLNSDAIVENNSLSAEITVSVPKTIYVPRDYATIQEAVDIAHPRDTIEVAAGTYHESLVIEKPLSLIGENKQVTTIKGSEDSNVIAVWANGVKISGFTIRNGERGIYLWYSSQCIISENIIMRNKEGILLYYSNYNEFRYNTLMGNEFNFGVWGTSLSNFLQHIDTSNTVEGSPIYYWVAKHNAKIPNNAGQVTLVLSSSITVEDLSLDNNTQAVLLVCTDDSTIENVQVKNSRFGIMLLDSRNNVVQHNHLVSNIRGIYLSRSDNNTIKSNRLLECGIKSEYSSNNTISDNKINESPNDALVLYHSDHNYIHRNQLSENIEGMRLICSGNNILRNNHISYNEHGFGVSGDVLDHFIQDIDVSNTIDSDPIHYLINEKDRVLDDKSLPNVGYLAVINSTNVKVKGLTLDKNLQGILLAFTSNSELSSLTIYENINGIELFASDGNLISECELQNIELNILLRKSQENVIIDNYLCSEWATWGLKMEDSRANTVACNYFYKLNIGIYIDSSEKNYFIDNTLEENSFVLVLQGFLVDNAIVKNKFINSYIPPFILGVLGNNTWDVGYPSGGNYWSSHYCTGNPSDGSQPYVIDKNNVDHYPFQDPDSWVIIGDINNDGTVNILDVAAVAMVFTSEPRHDNWNAIVDVSNDKTIDILDIILVALDFARRL